MTEPGDVLIGRYELEQVIARGGMATVWRARDQVLARRVAVKVLHPHLAEDEGFLERFRREALAAASLTHPHVVSIYDTGEDPERAGGCHFIVMEHCGGGTLGTLLKADGPFPSERVAWVGSTICDALAYAHSKDIVHRDVKPANVLVGDDGMLKVGDFGIAKAVSAGSDITTTGAVIGTVAYISPEYAGDRELDARSDIYSLGVVLYELAVGRPPFVEDTSLATAMKHINAAPPTLRSLRAGIPRALESVILKALEKDPDQRFESAGAMRDALRSISGGGGQTQVIRTPAQPAPTPAAGGSFRSESRWIGPVIALIIAAVLLAGVLTALFGDDPPGDIGGNNGGTTGSGTAEMLEAPIPTDFDPFARDGEDSDGLPFVVDGNPATTWDTDDYQASFDTLGKPGVGVLFDFGEETTVARVEVITPSSDIGLELLAGNTAPSSEEDLDSVASEESAGGTVTFEAGNDARYWLVWITHLPGGGAGSAAIGEVKFFGE